MAAGKVSLLHKKIKAVTFPPRCASQLLHPAPLAERYDYLFLILLYMFLVKLQLKFCDSKNFINIVFVSRVKVITTQRKAKKPPSAKVAAFSKSY
jgi:hypothetical protein